MKKIIIYTNERGIARIKNKDWDFKFTSGIFYGFDDTKIKCYKDSLLFVASENINESNLFLIFDEIIKEEFEKFIENYNHKLYILKHNSPSYLENIHTQEQFKEAFTDFNGEVVLEHGMHEPSPNGRYYPEVIEILENETKTNKFEAILNAVFLKNNELDSRLNLLHNLYNGEDFSSNENKLLDKEKKALKTLKEVLKEKKFEQTNKEHLNKLTEFRDMLLKNAIG